MIHCMYFYLMNKKSYYYYYYYFTISLIKHYLCNSQFIRIFIFEGGGVTWKKMKKIHVPWPQIEFSNKEVFHNFFHLKEAPCKSLWMIWESLYKTSLKKRTKQVISWHFLFEKSRGPDIEPSGMVNLNNSKRSSFFVPYHLDDSLWQVQQT